MKVTIALRHRRTEQCFLVKREKDGIYLAFPQKENLGSEPIFLTRTAKQWVGDCPDKLLVKKLGQGIEAASRQKTTLRQKPA